MLEPGFYRLENTHDTLEVTPDAIVRYTRGQYLRSYDNNVWAERMIRETLIRLPDRVVPKFKTPDGNIVEMVAYRKGAEELAYEAFGQLEVQALWPEHGGYLVRDLFGLRFVTSGQGYGKFKLVPRQDLGAIARSYARFLNRRETRDALFVSDSAMQAHYPKTNGDPT